MSGRPAGPGPGATDGDDGRNGASGTGGRGTGCGESAFTVAIDGPAASGKGTIARALAARFGMAHLDTGLLYREVARRVRDEGASPEAAARALEIAVLAPAALDTPRLRAPDVAAEASRVAALPEVRAALLSVQRRFARRPGGAVLDGRDIGTVICPDAEVKLFVVASPEERARRRHRELVAQGLDVDLEEVLADIRARDARDAGRATAPLRPADDAVLLDTSALTVDEAIARAAAVVEERCRALAAARGRGHA